MLAVLIAAALPVLSLQATRTQLPNGLTLVVSQDHSVPGVAVYVGYRVGSQDEEPGRTGFAHLFEHLMFMGARHVPYPQFDTIMEAAGGTNNANTSNDWTRYYEVGPANLLETFLWMEADRMATLGQTITAEKLETQRKVVLNERRESYENRPYGLAGLALTENLFPEGDRYHFPTIGSAEDIEAAQLSDVKRFFARYYVPSNATLTVVGDTTPAEVQRLAGKYFGFIPAGKPNVRPPVQPLQLRQEKRVALTDKVELPQVLVGWVSPEAFTDGDADCDLLAAVLGAGKASRLYERLVHRDQIATEVNVGQSSQQRHSTLTIRALARPGHTNQELLAAIDDELRKLKQEGPTQVELESARIRIVADTARGLEGLQARAARLLEYQDGLGDPNAIDRDLGRYASATTARLRDTARAVLTAGRVVVEVTPESDQPDGAKPQAGGGR
jgi:predicted Zn-dependent peptidase